MKKTILAMTVLCLMGCAAKPSPQAHATHWVLTAMESHDANLRVDKAGSIKSMLPAFESAYAHGKELRSKGGTLAQAQDYARQIQEHAETKATRGSNFSNHKPQTFSNYYSPREAKELGKALAETFLDGFNGK